MGSAFDISINTAMARKLRVQQIYSAWMFVPHAACVMGLNAIRTRSNVWPDGLEAQASAPAS